ncbi:MAG: hypothetical protein R3332_01935 [Pseudohongiellaceae bacterium]|nr:hypothetical protein [Pseudohongiellaceae bacterium]
MLRLMKEKKHSRSLISSIAMAGVLAGASIYTPALLAADEEDGQRKPPPTRSSDTLSDRVYRAVEDIQALLSPEDGSEPKYAEAKEELDDLYERYDRMNNFEKSTILNFYTNYYLGIEDINNALRIFEQILTLEDLRVDSRLRSLMALGQLYMGEERYEESIDAYTRWREESDEEHKNVFLGLANSHYNLEQYEQAIPFLISHIDMLVAGGEEVRKNVYALLNLMYIELEDYNSALDVTKTMVTLFDEPSDWRNLAAIYGYLDDDAKRIETLGISFAKGYMENEAEYLNLSQSLAGNDAPYTGAKVLEAGFEAGIVEQNEDNLNKLVQMYMLAAEYEMALEPATRIAEMAETGAGYDQLGYLYYLLNDYASSADAIEKAIERGGLDDLGDTQMMLARVLVELDRYEEAAVAARRGDELGARSADTYIRFIENSKTRYETLQRRKQDAIDFYRS